MKARLEVLRVQATINALRATTLRVDDLIMLTRDQVELAMRSKSYLAVTIRKTGLPSHIVFGKVALDVTGDYLKEGAMLHPGSLSSMGVQETHHGDGSSRRKLTGSAEGIWG